jgi:hypothetical protein
LPDERLDILREEGAEVLDGRGTAVENEAVYDVTKEVWLYMTLDHVGITVIFSLASGPSTRQGLDPTFYISIFLFRRQDRKGRSEERKEGL